MSENVLIVDDDEELRTQMKWGLSDDYTVLTAEDRVSAIRVMEASAPDVALLDLGLPPRPNDTSEGFLALGEILAAHPFTKVIVITGQGEKENGLRAAGEGAYDFMGKPIDMVELKIVLKRAFHIAQLEKEYRKLQRSRDELGFENMLGASPQMQQAFTIIRKVAGSEASVLVLGESGTGKEMAALAVHNRSGRREGPFVAINCSAIPEALLESELFGHEKGAFTGAHVQRKGRIEHASGGTLFLDEIGELPASLQVKLLRFLQEQRIERVGGREEIHIDTRVIAATNSDLKTAMQEGRFREDLYYRLAVVVLRLPPLREREGDVPVLASIFLKRFAEAARKDIAGFDKRALQALQNYEWPGNVREMENRIHRAVIMSDGHRITRADLEMDTVGGESASLNLKEAREAVEKHLIQRALARNRGNISRAAGDLGISRPTLYELMEKLGVGEVKSAKSSGTE